jgi:imidazolonepropionase-like amidohydrolase
MNQALAAALLLLAGLASAQDAPLTAFVDVSVLPMDGERVLAHQTVLVRGDRIESVGPAATTQVPADARRIHGAGKFLMPGIAEMHGHVPSPKAPAELTESYLALFALRGATTVRTMYGFPNQFELRERIQKGELFGPTLYTAAPPLSGNSVSGAEHARELVRKYAADGYDLLKIHEGLTPPEYEAIAEEAGKLGLRMAGHVPDEVGVRRAIEAGQGIDHLDGYWEDAGEDEAVMLELARATKAKGTWVVATQDLWRTLYGSETLDVLDARPELAYAHPKEREQWRAMKSAQLAQGDAEMGAKMLVARDKMLGLLAREDVHLMLGSDAPQMFSVPGFSLEHELPALERAGVSRWQILRAATSAPAEYFGAQQEFGTVQSGRRADLLLLDGDPTADIRNVHKQAGVMVRGKWLDAAAIRARLEAIAARLAPKAAK